MKLTNTVVTGTSARKGRPNKETKIADARALWGKKENSRVYEVGRFLAHVEGGKSLAQWLIEKEKDSDFAFEIDSLSTATGRVLPVNAFKLSLSTIAIWGCPHCQSCHGANVGPSAVEGETKRVRLLESTKWYYSPGAKSLFTISETCYGEYVKALGYAKNFGSVPAPTPQVEKDTKVG
jgi:hypothetical protein